MTSGGRIVLFSTTQATATSVTGNYLTYVASKGAVEQMTRVMSKDLARKGIMVNCVSPGPTATDLFLKGKPEGLLKTIAGLNPQGRLGKPEEVADVVAFLSSPACGWVSGQNLRVNGGMAWYCLYNLNLKFVAYFNSLTGLWLVYLFYAWNPRLSFITIPTTKVSEGQVPIGLPTSIQTNSSIQAPSLKFAEDSLWPLKVFSGATRTHRIAKQIFILRLLFVSLNTFRNWHHFSLSATNFFCNKRSNILALLHQICLAEFQSKPSIHPPLMEITSLPGVVWMTLDPQVLQK